MRKWFEARLKGVKSGRRKSSTHLGNYCVEDVWDGCEKHGWIALRLYIEASYYGTCNQTSASSLHPDNNGKPSAPRQPTSFLAHVISHKDHLKICCPTISQNNEAVVAQVIAKIPPKIIHRNFLFNFFTFNRNPRSPGHKKKSNHRNKIWRTCVKFVHPILTYD